MSSVETSPIAIFGDLETDLWGIVTGGERPQAAVAVLGDPEVHLQPAELDLADDDVWTLSGRGCELRIERAEATTATARGRNTLSPCRVSGSAKLAETELELDVAGVRSSALPQGGSSLRLLGAWFPAGHEVAILAARPPGARGQDRDSVEVVAQGEEHARVMDPRLSTTYDAAGQPLRVGVELWLGEDEEGDQWPRRVAGVATGSCVTGGSVSAYGLQCVSRGELGAGVYVLVQGAR